MRCLSCERVIKGSPAVVAPEWLACFPAKDRAALFDAFFERAPSAVLLQALVSCAPLRGCCSRVKWELLTIVKHEAVLSMLSRA